MSHGADYARCRDVFLRKQYRALCAALKVPKRAWILFHVAAKKRRQRRFERVQRAALPLPDEVAHLPPRFRGAVLP